MDAIAKVVEGISAEISSLKEQRHAAHAEAERAGARLKELSGLKEQRHAAHAEAEQAVERLKELSGRKAPLLSGTISGEREDRGKLLAAMEDLAEVLNKESAVLSRTK